MLGEKCGSGNGWNSWCVNQFSLIHNPRSIIIIVLVLSNRSYLTLGSYAPIKSDKSRESISVNMLLHSIFPTAAGLDDHQS